MIYTDKKSEKISKIWEQKNSSLVNMINTNKKSEKNLQNLRAKK
jgi:hypothetical protein